MHLLQANPLPQNIVSVIFSKNYFNNKTHAQYDVIVEVLFVRKHLGI